MCDIYRDDTVHEGLYEYSPISKCEKFDEILDRSLRNKSHDTFHSEYLKKKTVVLS